MGSEVPPYFRKQESKKHKTMKPLKPYKERIWEVVKANDNILNASKVNCAKRNPVCDIEATTANGERYGFALWNDNTLLYSIDGATEMHLTAEQRERLQEEFCREFDSANLHLDAMIEADGKMVFSISAFLHYRWMGLREFRRCAGRMSATMDRCAEWLKQHIPYFVQRKIDIDFAATHTLLVENNY